MNTSELLPAAELGAAARWEPPQLLGGRRCPEDVMLHTARQLDDLEAVAYQDGFVRGQTEGYAAGQQQARAEAQRLRELIQHLGRPLAQVDEDVERTLVALTIEVARRLVQQELQLDPAKVCAVVKEALSALHGTAREVRVLAHPEDARLLQEQFIPPPEISEFRIVADASLQRGDCRVVSEGAHIDARLDTRQASLAQSLMGEGE